MIYMVVVQNQARTIVVVHFALPQRIKKSSKPLVTNEQMVLEIVKADFDRGRKFHQFLGESIGNTKNGNQDINFWFGYHSGAKKRKNNVVKTRYYEYIRDMVDTVSFNQGLTNRYARNAIFSINENLELGGDSIVNMGGEDVVNGLNYAMNNTSYHHIALDYYEIWKRLIKDLNHDYKK